MLVLFLPLKVHFCSFILQKHIDGNENVNFPCVHIHIHVDPTSNSAHCTLNQHLLWTLDSAVQGLREENNQILNQIAASIEIFIQGPYLFILVMFVA